MDPFLAKQDPRIKTDYAAAQEQVPRYEQNNCVIQERLRAAWHRFTCTHLPRISVKYLVGESTTKLVFFSNKHGASNNFSPRMIMHKEKMEYEHHCKYQISEYAQSHNEPQHKNNNEPQSLDYFHLRSKINTQCGAVLFHEQTKNVLKCRNLTKIPITRIIIKQVHARHAAGIKIKNQANNEIFYYVCIAGVYYDKENFDDNV